MRDYIQKLVVSSVAKLLRPVRLPEDLVSVKSQLPQTILITQSHSLVVQGLLLSFAQRLGFESIQRLTSVEIEEALNQNSQSVRPLAWASMHDLGVVSWPDERHGSHENPLHVRTLNVFQVKGPIRKWPSFKPSRLWLWGLIPTRRILTVTVGESIMLHQQSSQRLLRKIKIDFTRTLKLVRGTPFEPREEQARAILSGPEFEREIQVLSERSGISVSRGKKLAEAAFYELSANPRRFMYDALSIVARFIVSRLFNDVQTHGLDRLIPAIKEHTVVLVPMHRSHLDYVLVGYKLFSERVNPPLVAAGINLAFWPFGFIFRSVGAYFVKRNGRDRFHAVVLKRYVSYLASRGHLQEFFIEGGRSRSGKMLPPKLGLLSVIMEAWKPERPKDILFVPVSITYENVIEDEAFGHENSGGSKVRESIGSTLRALDIFRRRYGEVLIEFGDPISLKAYRQKISDQAPSRVADKTITQRLGFDLCRAIRDQSNPGLTSLCYTALLMANHYGLERSDLIARITSLHSYLKVLRSAGWPIGRDTPQLQRMLRGETDILDELAAGGVVRSEGHFGKNYYFIPGSRRFTADYYRNSVLHYFFPLALFSLAQLRVGIATNETISKLYPFFEHDLLLEPLPEFLDKCEQLSHLLCTQEILCKHEQGVSFSESRQDLFIPALLSSYLQAYQWVSHCLLAINHPTDSAKEQIRYEEFIGLLLAGYKAASYVGTVTRTESSARSTITSIVTSLEARNMIRCIEGSAGGRIIEVETAQLSNLQAEIEFLKGINQSVNRWLLES